MVMGLFLMCILSCLTLGSFAIQLSSFQERTTKEPAASLPPVNSSGQGTSFLYYFNSKFQGITKNSKKMILKREETGIQVHEVYIFKIEKVK